MEKRVYFDHDSADGELLEDLRLRQEIDCLTSEEARMTRAPDDEQLRFAADASRVLITANRGDFARLHAQWMSEGKHHAGIIIAEQSMAVSERMRRIRLLLAETGAELADQLVYLNTWFGVGNGSRDTEPD